jgi:hypothetical protein
MFLRKFKRALDNSSLSEPQLTREEIERQIAQYTLYLEVRLYELEKVRQRRGLLFALIKRKSQLNAHCPLAKLPKDLLVLILRQAHQAEGIAQPVVLSTRPWHVFLRDEKRRRLFGRVNLLLDLEERDSFQRLRSALGH